MRRGWRGGGGAAIGAVGAAFYMNGGGGRPPQAYAGSGAGNGIYSRHACVVLASLGL